MRLLEPTQFLAMGTVGEDGLQIGLRAVHEEFVDLIYQRVGSIESACSRCRRVDSHGLDVKELQTRATVHNDLKCGKNKKQNEMAEGPTPIQKKETKKVRTW